MISVGWANGFTVNPTFFSIHICWVTKETAVQPTILYEETTNL